MANDETISILGPQIFTPTLHANLVSKILALRRDQNEKTKQIESLENALLAMREEQEKSQQTLTTMSNESRSLKRQLFLLEGGTSVALGQLSRERDEAVGSVGKTNNRLDLAQKKIRSQEDNCRSVHEIWSQDRRCWEDERRKYERKLHIAASRLKIVSDEVAAYQANQPNGAYNGADQNYESDGEHSGKENDAGSVGTTNTTDNSLLSSPALHPSNSLGDELIFDDDNQADVNGCESVLLIRTSPKHTITLDRESALSLCRNCSIESLNRYVNVDPNKLFKNPIAMEALKGQKQQAAQKALHMNTAAQYFPPLLPEVSRSKSPTSDLSVQRVGVPVCGSLERSDTEIEIVQSSGPLVIEPRKTNNKMVSTASQTIEIPSNPPKAPQPSSIELLLLESAPAIMATSSTKTKDLAPASPEVSCPPSRQALYMSPSQIPASRIRNLTSRPATPQGTRQPPHSTDFGCQVTLRPSTPTSHASVQTEEICIDRRWTLLLPPLQPSAISYGPRSSMVSKSTPDNELSPAPGNTSRTSQDPCKLPSSPIPYIEEDREICAGLFDDHPLSAHKEATRQGNCYVSIFTGSDTASSDECDEFGDIGASYSEYPTALSAPRPQLVSTKTTKNGSFRGVTTSPELKPALQSTVKPIITELHSRPDTGNQPKTHSTKSIQPPAPAPPFIASGRISSLRNGAVLQSDIATQQNRSRSPSLPDGQYSPFPIPDRASSKRSQIDLFTSINGCDSPTRGGMWLSRDSNRSSNWSHSVHKVRSALALRGGPRYCRNGSRSPPPLFPSTKVSESPDPPPLPQNDITAPLNGRHASLSNYYRHWHDLSADKHNQTAPTSDSSASYTAGVIDAIAQTMAGEWMLKYVRRRKSLSVAESNNRCNTTNYRRKRWVWLAPYERSILWSSKHPSSGSRFLGRADRKLVVQSVLDVKDDNSRPNDMPSEFDRSILILTPQRALKFTASSTERHYLWLTALSFLAHSSQEVPHFIPVPHFQAKPPQMLPDLGASQPNFKRGGIPDSIRVAKSDTEAAKMGVFIVPSIPSVPSPCISAAARFRIRDASSARSGGNSREESSEAAEPPFIPRFSGRDFHDVAAHGRKRSNKGRHVAPPPLLRGSSKLAGAQTGHHNPGQTTENKSIDTITSSEVYQSQALINAMWDRSRTELYGCTSSASPHPGDFFDAIGTVKMEAITSPFACSRAARAL